eukprot:COSAG06_NODE_17245_length_953_cov_0.987119_2_plen_190_part_00
MVSQPGGGNERARHPISAPRREAAAGAAAARAGEVHAGEDISRPDQSARARARKGVCLTRRRARLAGLERDVGKGERDGVAGGRMDVLAAVQVVAVAVAPAGADATEARRVGSAAPAVRAVDGLAGLVVGESAGLRRERAAVVRADALVARLSPRTMRQGKEGAAARASVATRPPRVGRGARACVVESC